MFSFFKKKKGEPEAETPAQAVPNPDLSAPEPVQSAPVQSEKKSIFQHIKDGLKKTRNQLGEKIVQLFPGLRKIDESLLEELEEILISTDLGFPTTQMILEKIRKNKGQDLDAVTLKKRLQAEIEAILNQVPRPVIPLDEAPSIFLVVGVNGVGKTTTIGKLAHHWKEQGKRVLICAADTFRAAAREQLEVWSKRAGADIEIKENSNDPAAVVYDALERVKAEKQDILIIDTAGRLHNNPNLMNELAKVKRVITREFPNGPHRVFLILDAITGQNALQQAKQFVEKVGVTDLVITKLDGTAKGGVAVAIANELSLPIQFIGVGEQMDQLLPFDAASFSESLIGGNA
ncbi:MAG: signal recognition particle-docking protein FtsY [Acidobacteria bacterium]|nr:signal recognition particle-docking protein FtsY [Acidobacteriota bacterium]